MNEVFGLIVYCFAGVALLVLVNLLVEKINKVFTKKDNNDVP